MSWKVTNLEKIESTAALGQRVEEHTRVGLTEKKCWKAVTWGINSEL